MQELILTGLSQEQRGEINEAIVNIDNQGYVYMPYIIVTEPPIVNCSPETMERYSKKTVDPRYYGKIRIPDIKEE